MQRKDEKRERTHAIFKRRHDLHAFPWHPELVGVDVVRGSTLLALLAVRLHGCGAIVPVNRHPDHGGEISLKIRAGSNRHCGVTNVEHECGSGSLPWGNPLRHSLLAPNTSRYQTPERRPHLVDLKKK